MSKIYNHERSSVNTQTSPRFNEKLIPVDLRIFQVNLGRWCNQSCNHCHVGASPLRSETMSTEVVDRCLEIIARTPSIEVVDLTGGAPEGQPEFRRFAAACRKLGKRVIDRCNLTILTEPGFEDLAEWLAEHDIEIVASYPDVVEAVTDGRRGSGVHARSMVGLRRLNELGYGTKRPLHLVHNPHDLSLTGDQQVIENDFRRKLTPQGIEFSGLYALNNMPLGRFLESLVREGRHQEYMEQLVGGFNPVSLPGLMCRHQLSVAWDGRIYDCDFNQIADMEQPASGTVFAFDLDRWLGRTICTAAHCFGCTAAAGSSCTGSLVPVGFLRGKTQPAASSLQVAARVEASAVVNAEPGMDLAAIRRYYGEILQKSGDLKTDACCTVADTPLWLRRALNNVHTEVLDRYFGCGLVAPEAVEGCTVVDLGCGSGRDVYVLAQLVGEEGRVIGVDMTPEQAAIARRHGQWHAQRHGYGRVNTQIIEGFIEDLSAIGDNSTDIVISNCVLNLSPDKPRVLREVFRVLKPGGEFYFSDVYADRRLAWDIRRNEVLWGECLAGALYWMDFLTLAKGAGFRDPRLVTDRVLAINNPELAALLGPAKFWSATWRLFKLAMLEPICEDFGQVVRYRGGIAEHDLGLQLDNHHFFEKGQSVKVCSNTWHMLKSTRFAPYFDFWGDEQVHFGAFADCGKVAPFTSRHHGPADDPGNGGSCGC
jgi:radical SAM/Cys-rich protein